MILALKLCDGFDLLYGKGHTRICFPPFIERSNFYLILHDKKFALRGLNSPFIISGIFGTIY